MRKLSGLSAAVIQLLHGGKEMDVEEICAKLGKSKIHMYIKLRTMYRRGEIDRRLGPRNKAGPRRLLYFVPTSTSSSA